ncbi:DUF7572 family protein [Nocardia wallacei]|uniref:DUF7572 family protein n=1 Tax=Nocardia wallacei TaxID=480035 RepID=UPI003CC7DE5E
MAFPTALRPRTELGAWPAVEVPVVYVMVPAMVTESGASEFVIIAHNPAADAVEMFPCDEDGRIEEWEPLASLAGSDHARLLEDCGYEVVIFDAA